MRTRLKEIYDIYKRVDITPKNKLKQSTRRISLGVKSERNKIMILIH